MRQKRAKAYKKQMLVYVHTFKFRAPYQVIVDDKIVAEMFKQKMPLTKFLSNTLQDEVKPMITQCCMKQLYLSHNEDLVQEAKKFERRRCGHKDNAIDPSKCIESVVNVDGKNKHRYVVATQDLELRRKLRRVPGVPLVYVNRSVMIMEPLSSLSGKLQEEQESAKLTKGLNDVKGVVDESDDEHVAKKRKGPKQPNPLSMKKKQKKVEIAPEKKRRRRHRKADDNAGSEADDNAGSEADDNAGEDADVSSPKAENSENET